MLSFLTNFIVLIISAGKITDFMQNTTKNTVFEQILCVFLLKKHIFGLKQNIRRLDKMSSKIKLFKIGTHFAYTVLGLTFCRTNANGNTG